MWATGIYCVSLRSQLDLLSISHLSHVSQARGCEMACSASLSNHCMVRISQQPCRVAHSTSTTSSIISAHRAGTAEGLSSRSKIRVPTL